MYYQVLFSIKKKIADTGECDCGSRVHFVIYWSLLSAGDNVFIDKDGCEFGSGKAQFLLPLHPDLTLPIEFKEGVKMGLILKIKSPNLKKKYILTIIGLRNCLKSSKGQF